MTEQLKYRAKIKARGLDTTGVTEDHARKMAATLGSHTMFIVEGIHDTVITDAEGNQQVTIRVTSVEPVPATEEDTVRRFQRAIYATRPDVEGQQILKGTSDEPRVSDVARELDAASTTMESETPEPSPEGVWDGDLSAPLDPPADDEASGCDYPGCSLDSEHDGDHDVPSDPEPETGGTVAQFSARRKG